MTVVWEGTIADSSAMEGFGRRVGEFLRAGDLLVLTGPLGAGKTTMTRGIGLGVGVRGQVASPTFVLARTHPALHVGGPPLVHVDAYRLGSAAELDDLDIDYDRSIVVVEWGAGLLDGVTDSWLEVTIERPTGAGSAAFEVTQVEAEIESEVESEVDEPRHVVVDGHGPRWDGVALPL